MNAIVLTFDRLPLSFLGCYGNRGIDTPAFDRLAASSVVFDDHFVDTAVSMGDPPDHRIADAWWSGRSGFYQSDPIQSPGKTALELLHASGVEIDVVRESGVSTPSVPASVFHQTLQVDGEGGWPSDPNVIPFARLIQTAIDQIGTREGESNSPHLLWLQSCGVPVPWIPPEAFAEPSLAELGIDQDERAELLNLDQRVLSGGRLVSDDAATEAICEQAALTESEWKQSRCIFSVYVELLDAWLEQLLDCLESQYAGRPTLLIVTAGSGCWLGEGQMDLSQMQPLCDALVHVPLIVRVFDSNDTGNRRHDLTQSIDLAPTLLEWFGLDDADGVCDGQSLLNCIRGKSDVGRTHVVIGNDLGERGIRTHDFYLITSEETIRQYNHSSSDVPATHLFVKPDDLWDIHDVAAQDPEQVEQLLSRIKDDASASSAVRDHS